MAAPPSVDELITSAWHLRIEDSFAIIATTILFYDHMLTFSEEVKHIWKKPKTPRTEFSRYKFFDCLIFSPTPQVSLMFLLNRYFAPPVFIICMVAVFSPNWTVETCTSFAKFEGVLTLVTVMTAESMLIMRVFAVYHKSRSILITCLTIWLAQLCLMSYVLAHSGPVVIPRTPVTYGCVLVADPSLGSLDILFVVPSIVFDTVIFIMLMVALVKRARESPLSMMLRIILRDGILYFVVVVLLNAAWTGTGLGLASDMKNILSFISTAMTNVLIGRLTLNLRKNSSSLVFDTSSNGRLRRFIQFGDASSGTIIPTDLELNTPRTPLSANSWKTANSGNSV